MNENKHKSRLPHYQGQDWLEVELPVKEQPWLLGKQRSVGKDRGHRASSIETLQGLLELHRWRWPKQPVYFFSDLHADMDAFLASLVASGGVKKTGGKDHDFKRIMLRKGMVNFECDATIDRNSRKKEGLDGCGAAVTIFHPDKLVMGISTDYPFIKVFDPTSLG